MCRAGWGILIEEEDEERKGEGGRWNGKARGSCILLSWLLEVIMWEWIFVKMGSGVQYSAIQYCGWDCGSFSLIQQNGQFLIINSADMCVTEHEVPKEATF